MLVLPLWLQKKSEPEPDLGPEGGYASPELPELLDVLPVEGEGLDGAEVAVMTLLVLVEGEGLVLLLLLESPEEVPESHPQMSAQYHTK